MGGKDSSAPGGNGRGPSPPTARRYPEVVTRTRNPVRRWAHILFAAGGWALFLVTWYYVFFRHTDRAAYEILFYIGLTFIGVWIVNILWVSFNLAIYRSRGSRVRAREHPLRITRDTIGRRLETPGWPALRASRLIEIEVDGEGAKKVYTPLDREEAPGPPDRGAR